MIALLKKVLHKLYQLFMWVFFRAAYDDPGRFKAWIIQKVIGINRSAYWPVHFTSRAGNPRNVHIGIYTAPGLSPGCYIQAIGNIYMGDYVLVAPNVGIISANHDVYDVTKHIAKDVRIGSYSWIGMNAVILPGVELGEFTMVGAGSVVTHSFPEGYCVIAGNPAKKIRDLEPEKCVRWKVKYEYIGYKPAKKVRKQ